jgi:DNA-binding protein HU-beta
MKKILTSTIALAALFIVSNANAQEKSNADVKGEKVAPKPAPNKASAGTKEVQPASGVTPATPASKSTETKSATPASPATKSTETKTATPAAPAATRATEGKATNENAKKAEPAPAGKSRISVNEGGLPATKTESKKGDN